MGKGSVVSGGSEGSYQVSIKYSRARIDAEIAKLETSIAALDDDITAQSAEVDDKETAKVTAEVEMNAAISALSSAETDAEITQALEEVRAKTAAYVEAGGALQAAQTRLVQLQARRDEAQSRLDTLNAIPADPTQQAWCADYTEDLSGEVGTIELPASEGNVNIVIQPGYGGVATYSGSRDGQLAFRAGMTGPQAYYNAAILPGWQKFKPLYRAGTLTAVNEETDIGSVAFSSETSSAQSLPINQAETLSGVPIRYMFCNAKAFEVGDEVVVEFAGQDWGSPTIIGFANGPKPCCFTITYGSANLIISGDNEQCLADGETGTPVTASNATEGDTYYVFWKWSDDVLTATRTDSGSDLTEDTSVAALAAEFPASFRASYDISIVGPTQASGVIPCAETVCNSPQVDFCGTASWEADPAFVTCQFEIDGCEINLTTDVDAAYVVDGISNPVYESVSEITGPLPMFLVYPETGRFYSEGSYRLSGDPSYGDYVYKEVDVTYYRKVRPGFSDTELVADGYSYRGPRSISELVADCGGAPTITLTDTVTGLSVTYTQSSITGLQLVYTPA